jgi:hypothetical protein
MDDSRGEALAPVEEMDAQQMEAEIAALSARMDVAMHRMLVLIRRFDERRDWASDGHKSCAAWPRAHLIASSVASRAGQPRLRRPRSSKMLRHFLVARPCIRGRRAPRCSVGGDEMRSGLAHGAWGR